MKTMLLKIIEICEWTPHQKNIKMAKSMKTYLSYLNAHQKVISAEEDFNNQVIKITCFVNTSRPLS